MRVKDLVASSRVQKYIILLFQAFIIQLEYLRPTVWKTENSHHLHAAHTPRRDFIFKIHIIHRLQKIKDV
jgi:hypothetical protein